MQWNSALIAEFPFTAGYSTLIKLLQRESPGAHFSNEVGSEFEMRMGSILGIKDAFADLEQLVEYLASQSGPEYEEEFKDNLREVFGDEVADEDPGQTYSLIRTAMLAGYIARELTFGARSFGESPVMFLVGRRV